MGAEEPTVRQLLERGEQWRQHLLDSTPSEVLVQMLPLLVFLAVVFAVVWVHASGLAAGSDPAANRKPSDTLAYRAGRRLREWRRRRLHP